MSCRLGLIGLTVAATAAIGLAVPLQAAGAATLASPAAFKNATSTGQAGYEIGAAPASVSESVKFTVPPLTCTSVTTGIAPGAFDFTTTSATLATVFAACQSGAPEYFGVIAADGTVLQTSFTPAAGDAMIATLSETASASSVKLKDVTQSRAQSLTGSGGTNSLLVEGIDSLDLDSTQLPVPQFSPMVFKAATIDGLTPSAAGAVAVNMKPSAGAVQIKTGPLAASGNKWKEIFAHA